MLPILLYGLPVLLLLRGLALLSKDSRWVPLASLLCAIVLWWLIALYRPPHIGGRPDLIFIIGLILGIDLFLSLIALLTSRWTALALRVFGYVVLCLISFAAWDLGWEAFSREQDPCNKPSSSSCSRPPARILIERCPQAGHCGSFSAAIVPTEAH